MGRSMLYFGYNLAGPPASLRHLIGYWVETKNYKVKKRLLGLLLRLYWPFDLPKRFQKGWDTVLERAKEGRVRG